MRSTIIAALVGSIIFLQPLSQQDDPDLSRFGWDGYSWRKLDQLGEAGETIKATYVRAAFDGALWAQQVLGILEEQARDSNVMYLALSVLNRPSPVIIECIRDLNLFYADSGNRHFMICDALMIRGAEISHMLTGDITTEEIELMRQEATNRAKDKKRPPT